MPADRTEHDASSFPPIHIELPAILDDRAANLWQRRIDDALTGGPEVLVLDCRQVRFVDSGGLRLLLSATRTGDDYGTRVVTFDPAGTLDHLRQVVDLERSLIIETTLPR